jgi:hypothetical protein
MFPVSHKDLGTLRAGIRIAVDFPYTDNIATLTNIRSPCDCTDSNYLPNERVVRIYYTPKAVPEHLRLENKNSYNTQKTFTVTFTTKDNPGNTQTAVLIFTAKIVE